MEKQIKDFVAVNFIFQKECEDMEDLIRKWESSRWISVKDRLPEENQEVVSLSIDTPEIAIFRKGKFYFNDIDLCRYDVKNVTHWLVLPESPK